MTEEEKLKYREQYNQEIAKLDEEQSKSEIKRKAGTKAVIIQISFCHILRIKPYLIRCRLSAILMATDFLMYLPCLIKQEILILKMFKHQCF